MYMTPGFGWQTAAATSITRPTGSYQPDWEIVIMHGRAADETPGKDGEEGKGQRGVPVLSVESIKRRGMIDGYWRETGREETSFGEDEAVNFFEEEEGKRTNWDHKNGQILSVVSSPLDPEDKAGRMTAGEVLDWEDRCRTRRIPAD